MKWERVTDYAIQSGNWTIAKYSVGGEWKYLLWLGREIQGGPFRSADEAKGNQREIANGRG